MMGAKLNRTQTNQNTKTENSRRRGGDALLSTSLTNKRLETSWSQFPYILFSLFLSESDSKNHKKTMSLEDDDILAL